MDVSTVASEHPGSTKSRVGASWFLWYTLVWLVLWGAQQTPTQLLLPLQLQSPDPNDWVLGVLYSGMVLGLGGLTSLVAYPLTGALSDRTTSRIGRRRPWAIGGSALAGASLLFLSGAEGPWLIGIAWLLFSTGFAVAGAAYTALIADQLDQQRGAASGAMSSAMAVSLVIGVGLFVYLGIGLSNLYIVLAISVIVMGIAGAFLLPDPQVRVKPSGSIKAPRSKLSSGFLWVVVSRMVVSSGNGASTALILFFLLFELGEPVEAASSHLLLVILEYTVFVTFASIIGGWYSDRTGKRRGLVIGSAFLLATGALFLAVFPSLPMVFVTTVLNGTGFGLFTTVGLAYAADLLPSGVDNARDLGWVNVATNLGPVIGPLLGALLVASISGFWLLYVAAAVICTVGGLVLLMIKRGCS